MLRFISERENICSGFPPVVRDDRHHLVLDAVQVESIVDVHIGIMLAFALIGYGMREAGLLVEARERALMNRRLTAA